MPLYVCNFYKFMIFASWPAVFLDIKTSEEDISLFVFRVDLKILRVENGCVLLFTKMVSKKRPSTAFPMTVCIYQQHAQDFFLQVNSSVCSPWQACVSLLGVEQTVSWWGLTRACDHIFLLITSVHAACRYPTYREDGSSGSGWLGWFPLIVLLKRWSSCVIASCGCELWTTRHSFSFLLLLAFHVHEK